jgi:ABC-type lipoprotein release transport system permease subunit
MKKGTPPLWARKFLQWFADPNYYEELQGDLEENYFRDIKSLGTLKARWNYIFETFKLFRPSVWNHSFFTSQNSNYMFRNYAKVTWRNLRKQKIFSFINLFGLAVSLSVCLLIISIIVDQLSFDKFHKKYANIHRIITYNNDLRYGWDEYLATTSLPLYENLKNNPVVGDIVRIKRNFWGDVETGKKTIPLSGHMADKDFFKIFSFELISGNPENALAAPFSVVLSESSKYKLFGDSKALGETIKVGRYGDYIVTGIMKDPPRTSHMQFDMIGSFASLEGLKDSGIYAGNDNWLNYTEYYIYITIPDKSETETLQNLLHRFGEVESKKINNRILDFELQSLAAITPGRDLANQIGPNFGIAPLRSLMILALLILSLACFNYVNLTLAKSLKRFKEVGIRKVMGSQKRQLVIQFVFESVCLSLIAIIPAFVLMVALKPQFFSMEPSSKARFLTFEFTPEIILAILGFTILTGLLAGIIPALILAGVKASAGLKDKTVKIFTGISLRKGLVVAQFGIAIFFIILTNLAYKYYNFQLDFDLGYAYDEIYNIELQGTDHEIFRAEFSQIPEVESISFSNYLLSTSTKNSNLIITENRQDTIRSVNMAIDENFLSNHNFAIIAGNDFNDFTLGNENRIIVNEKMVLAIGKANNADVVGLSVWLEGKEVSIAGVVKNFYHNRSSQPIEPFFFKYNPDNVHFANLKLRSKNLPATISKMETAWKRIDREVHSYKGEFYSRQIEASLSELKAMIKLIGFSALLTICISLLGILGMIIYTCETRVKEIGIRKVLGASISTVVYTLSKGYITILSVASIISLLLVYFLYSKIISPELNTKPDFTFLDYFGGVLAVSGIGLLIVIFNGYLTALRNPVISLKEE